MSLTGLDPNDPTPTSRREIILGAGNSGGSSIDNLVLLYGNKTSDGSETVETIGVAIVDEADCIARFGRRSEVLWEHRKFREQDTDATIYAIAVTDAGGGTQGTCTFTIGASEAATSTNTTPVTVDVEWGGLKTYYVVSPGDTTEAQGIALVAAINNAEGGTWPMTAAAGSTPNKHVITATAANVGDRGTYVLTPLRVTARATTGNTITKSAVTNGTGTDDFTTAYGVANTAGEYMRQVSPKSTTSTVSNTDNGIGEQIYNINLQNAPGIGKDQFLHFGLVGTNAQSITTATSANSAYAKFYWQKNSPWTPGMLAAYHAAITRKEQVAYPSANLVSYQTDDAKGRRHDVPPAYLKSDWATDAEIKASLNNGVCPVAFNSLSKSRLVRDITSRSLVGTNSDYKCREGHIPYAIAFSWRTLSKRYDDTKQPNIAGDLKQGATPRPLTTYTSDVKILAKAVVDDLTSANPLGKYPGPILNPDDADTMKNSFSVAKLSGPGGGGFEFSGEFRAVEHNLRNFWRLYETSSAQ